MKTAQYGTFNRLLLELSDQYLTENLTIFQVGIAEALLFACQALCRRLLLVSYTNSASILSLNLAVDTSRRRQLSQRRHFLHKSLMS